MPIVIELCPTTLIHALSITVLITLSWRFLLILGSEKVKLMITAILWRSS
jgi:hypothetical protein